MKRIIFEKALLPSGWAKNVCLDVNAQGAIENIVTDYSGDGEVTRGYALPGINNIHSHAFQRAMAGLAEYSTSPIDSFWTWRDIMYRFAEKISAEDLEVIASQLYIEMLKAGYVSVAEFHYLHNREAGQKGHVMSNAIMSAASKTGLGLCHLPVLYMASGFDGQLLSDQQQRFSHSVDQFIDLLNDLSRDIAKNDNQHLGMAFHSLRAVPEDALKEFLAHNPTSGPIHIHISEQMQEVEDCVAWSGKRPVEWLYDHAEVNERWCLIHATHLNDGEIAAIARSGAVVGICPTTEANLGDGLFPLEPFLTQGGRIGIGSDSHISVSLIEELRLLEYGQRLMSRRRNISVSERRPHTGSNLYHHSLGGGAQASGFDNGAIEVGKRADLIVLDERSPLLVGTPDSNIIDRFIFSGNSNPIKHVFVAGQQVISDYKHQKEEEISQRFATVAEALKKLLD